MNELIAQAAEILRKGGLIALPTETVYGLAADARNPAAIQRIFAVKQRPREHPLIVHIAHSTELTAWARDIPDLAWVLTRIFWPGPLTLILKKQPMVLTCLTGGGDTIALRMPAHQLARDLLRVFGGGIAAPSANKFTYLSPTSAAAIADSLDCTQLDLILDGGECSIGVESTILDLSGKQPLLLRPGSITAAQLAAVSGIKILAPEGKSAISMTSAPGQHAIHYAPQAKLYQVAVDQVLHMVVDFMGQNLKLACVGYNQLQLPVQHVKMPEQAVDYARVLYKTLRLLDQAKLDAILLEPVATAGAWQAIADRLSKATVAMII